MQKLLFQAAFFLLLIFGAACEKPSTAQDISEYEKLCTIYDEFVNDSRPEDIKLMRLTERIEKETPKVYVHFKNMALVDRSEKYQMYKTLAESESNKTWDCEVMKKYFAGDFDSKK